MKKTMIDHSYIKYLIKSNRSLILLLFIIAIIAVAFTSISLQVATDQIYLNFFIYAKYMSAILGMLYSLLIPIYLMRYLYQKNSADLYFSLPIKRKALWHSQMIVSYLLAIVMISIPLLITIVAFVVLGFKVDLIEAICFIVMLWIFMFIYQSIIYWICSRVNNLFDCIVASLAYTFLPLSMLVSTLIFLQTRIDVCMLGYGYELSELAFFDEIVQMSSLFIPLFSFTQDAIQYMDTNVLPWIVWLVIGCIANINARNKFINRKGEDSGQISNDRAIYPMILMMFAYCVLINIQVLSFSIFTLISIVCAFTLLMVLSFVAKRKIKFDWRYFSSFILILGLSSIFALAFDHTKGFYSLKEVPQQSYSYVSIVYYDYYEEGFEEVRYHFDSSNNQESIKHAKKIHEKIIDYIKDDDLKTNMASNQIFIDYYDENKRIERSRTYECSDELLVILKQEINEYILNHDIKGYSEAKYSETY